MHVHVYERFWMFLMVVVLMVLLSAVGYAAYGMGIHAPTDAGQLDPDRLSQMPPFNEPGVTREADGTYRAVMIARAFQFQPSDIRVPVGSTVEFVLTSQDVIHGFRIHGTTINAMVIPGQVTRVRYTFEHPGEYVFACHEYCGAGHHVMWGRVVVTQP